MINNFNFKNIAVCLYGQARNVEYTLPFIKELFNISNLNVDFFCSTKDYVLYLRTNENTINKVDKIKKIEKILNPKKSNIISIEDEKKIRYSERIEDDTSLFFSSFFDSLMLKQKYELENNIHYDLVITYRYDIILEDVDYFKRFFVMFSPYFQKNIFSGNFIVCNPFSFPHLQYIEEIEDFVLIGNNYAMNNIAGFILDNYIDTTTSPQNFKYIKPYTTISNGHIGLGYAIHKLCIQKHYFKNILGYNLNCVCIRNDSNLSISPFDKNAYQTHLKHYRKNFKL